MKQKVIKIKLSKIINKSIFTREAIDLMEDRIYKILNFKNAIISFDFAGVDFVSRSSADELLNLKEKLEKKDTIVNFTNINDEIKTMLKIVNTQRKNSKKAKKIDLKVEELNKVAYQF